MPGSVAINAKAAHPNAARLAVNFMLSQELQQFYTTFGRPPTRADVTPNPPDSLDGIRKRKVVTVLMSQAEEKQWSRTFDEIFKLRR